MNASRAKNARANRKFSQQGSSRPRSKQPWVEIFKTVTWVMAGVMITIHPVSQLWPLNRDDHTHTHTHRQTDRQTDTGTVSSMAGSVQATTRKQRQTALMTIDSQSAFLRSCSRSLPCSLSHWLTFDVPRNTQQVSSETGLRLHWHWQTNSPPTIHKKFNAD